MQLNLTEILSRITSAANEEEKISILQRLNTVPFRNFLICMYNKQKIKFLIDPSQIPIKPSTALDNHGAWFHQMRKVKYLFEGADGANLSQAKRYSIASEIAEVLHKDDVPIFLQMIAQKPLRGLRASTIVKAFGPILGPDTAAENE